MSSQVFNNPPPHSLSKRRYLIALVAVVTAGAVLAGLYVAIQDPRPITMHMVEGSAPTAASSRPVTETDFLHTSARYSRQGGNRGHRELPA